MADYQLGVIGGGNMAEAILRGVLGSNFLSFGEIVVSEPSPQRRQMLQNELRINVVEDNNIPAACARVLLAVKPQVMSAMLEQVAGAINPTAIVISIAAGVSTSKLDAALGHKGRLVRVMPNTPMLVGMGVSALAAGARATQADLEWSQKLFAASGKTCIVDENLIDAVTAVSGSGPAYFFYLIEAMIQAGLDEGLPYEVAAMLATQTCAGSAKLLEQTRERPEVLRARVTSPGGTTQRAIETMDAAGVKTAMIRAFHAAAARSRELGK